MNILNKYLTRNPCYKANVEVADSRYRTFQNRGPLGLMLHSVGCSQPSAQVFYSGWNNESYDRACVHSFIDANTGDIWQTLPWNYRGWHCGGSANNTHIGVEMCESKWIKYTGANRFEIIDRTKAVEDCVRTYNAAVELFAYICSLYHLDPNTAILSHKEGGLKNIASDHGDPEHYWSGLGMGYTMATFRAAVKKQMKKEDILYMTEQELRELVGTMVEEKVSNAAKALTKAYGKELDRAIEALGGAIDSHLAARLGNRIKNVDEIKSEALRENVRKLITAGFVNGGTPADVNPNDINMDYELVRIVGLLGLYVDARLAELTQDKDPPEGE